MVIDQVSAFRDMNLWTGDAIAMERPIVNTRAPFS